VEAIHALELTLHGGLPGLRDLNALESALGRPQNKWHYDEADLMSCAAAYGFGIAKNHAFADGNKRTAMVAMATFLEVNGEKFIASEAETVLTMLAVASGSMSEKQLAEWLRANTKARRRRVK
jgi:death-on-curing protein